jgi:hypothetical protein
MKTNMNCAINPVTVESAALNLVPDDTNEASISDEGNFKKQIHTNLEISHPVQLIKDNNLSYWDQRLLNLYYEEKLSQKAVDKYLLT